MLAAAASTRDPGAFEAVLQRFSKLIRKTARIYFRSTSDVDDCQQEVNLALFRCIHSLRNPASIRPFIIATTQRVALYQLRKNRVARRALDRPLGGVDDDLTAPENVEAAHAINRVKALLLRMREWERDPFVLRLGGMNLQEIADATGTSLPTTRRRLNRATRRFGRLAQRDIFVAHYMRDSGQEVA